MKTLQENFDNLNYWHPTIKNKFARLLVTELIDSKYSTLNNGLICNKNDFLQNFLPVYFDLLDQKFNSISRIELLFNEFRKKSIELEILLTNIFETVFVKLDNLEISWDNEQDIEPVYRYILIQDKISFDFPVNIEFLARKKYSRYSDLEFKKIQQEFESLLREKENKKLLSVGVNHCYGDILLPKTYDIIFDKRDLTKYLEQKTIVKYAFNYGTYFHADLWKGYYAHCLIEVIGAIPDIFNELPSNDGGMTLHEGIGLCTKYDWRYIKENI